MAYSTKTKLSEICDVQSGFTARTGLNQAIQGGVPTVQLRDLRGDADFDPASAPTYALGLSVERYAARAGDLLFRSRGDRNTAVVVASESKASAVAVLPLMVLRPHQNAVDPRYLAWFINQPATQRYFDKQALGTSIQMIRKTDLDELEVELPDLPTQKLIVEIDALARREQVLLRQLADKKLQLTSSALLAQVRAENQSGHAARPPHPIARRK